MPQTPIYSPGAQVFTDPDETVGFSLYDIIGQALHTYRFADLSEDEDGWFILTIGRQADCTVGNRPGSVVSRHHAEIEAIVGDGTVMLTDTSMYGTTVRHRDGRLDELKRLDSVDLVDGDEIYLPYEQKADAVLRFNYVYARRDG